MSKSLTFSLACAAAALILFLWIGHHIAAGEALFFDAPVRDGIHAIASPPLTLLMRGLTQLGSPAFLILATFIAARRLVREGRRGPALLLTFAGIGGEAVNEAVKLLYHRPRPLPFFDLSTPDSFSFPSGHSMGSISFYIALALILDCRPAYRIAAVLLAIAIGLTRIYLGVHYPSDVLGGFLAGYIWLTLLLLGRVIARY